MAVTDRLLGISGGVAIKPACMVASTTNLTLSSTQVVDGIAVGSCERVLVKDQTDNTENGIYVSDTSSWSRAKDFDGSRDAIPGTIVYVDRGTANGQTFWVFNSSSTTTEIDIGTTNITLSKVNVALSGVTLSTFSQGLLALSTASNWRSSDGLNIASTLGSTFSQTLLALSSATNWRSSDGLNLGSASTVDTGTSGTVVPFLDGRNRYSAGQVGDIITLSFASTISLDLSSGNNFIVTMTSSAVLGNPSNAIAGQSGVITVVHSTAGGDTITYSTDYRFAGGTQPTLSTGISSVDDLYYYSRSTVEHHISAGVNWTT